MRNDLLLRPWSIASSSPGWHDDFLESVYFLGNGRMGVRGYLPFEPDPRPVQKGLFIAGIFGEIKPGITDFVNLPAPICNRLFLDGVPAVLASFIERKLDFRHAVFQASFSLKAGANCADILYERFFPRDHPALLAQRIQIQPRSSCTVSLTSGMMPQSCNCTVPDDQTKENSETVQLAQMQEHSQTEDGLSCKYSILGSGLQVWQTLSCRADGASPSRTPSEVVFTASAGQPFLLEELACIQTSRDVDPRIASIPESWNYDALFEAHYSAWERVWAVCDFCPKTLADDELVGLRYSMFQLIGSCSSKDPTVSIGARGLSHTRYKGCYFWDTDLFMLPFFLHTDLEAAKNLCTYRVKTLPAAKAHAEKMNSAGARYPWMAALDGSEQCETWDIGASELHVTADVVYAINQYCLAANDHSFYLRQAAEVYIETARFWASRYTWNTDHTRADLLFCKGPDEYCGITQNNLFTNAMVQNNLSLAIKAAADLAENDPGKYASLCLSTWETESWRALKNAIVWPRDPVSGRLAQDETFCRLEPVRVSTLKPDDEASYHRVCFDRLQRYRVIKQADLLLLMTRFPSLFTPEEKAAAWQDYEPVCLHDSTLSFASHALFALQNGLKESGHDYLRKALLLDLRDIMGNTGKEGLHLACMGEAWQAARCC